MTFFKHFGVSLKTMFTSLGFLVKHGLWYYLLFPIILAVALWYGFDAFEKWASESLTNLLLEYLGFGKPAEIEDPTWWDSVVGFFSDTAASAVDKVVALTFGIMFSWLLYRTGKYIILILLSPVLAFLSEATEKRLTGNDYPFVMKEFIHDVVRGIGIAIRNMLLEYLVIITLFVISFFVPVLTPITMAIGYVAGWYFYGFAMFDYTNERRRLSIKESVRYLRKHKGMVIGNGMMFSIIFSVPLLGPIFAPIMAVTSATMSVHEVTGLGKQPPPPIDQS